ncbi:MAG: YkgJ family cysteine cluster protein, partial [Candidatus Hodarchaeota archaeon]
EDKKRMIIAPRETERGLAFVGLLKNSLGGCYFYDSTNKKCLIYELRPMFCRTFPFSFGFLEKNKDDTSSDIDIFYTEKGKQYCPGISSEAPFIDLDNWMKIGKRTLEDLKKNYKLIEDWNKIVKKRGISPTVKKYLLTISKLNNS